ncbi:hypothetical protein A3758_14460 [Oleiphilus sp. HI0118]|nr:hypothetical protein A3758_14460 [Oleiphilus sp. HI0118]
MLFVSGFMSSCPAISENRWNENLQYNAMLGASHLDGVLAFEVINDNHAVSLGFPWRLSYKYFLSADTDSYLIGVYAGQFDGDHDDALVNGANYDDVEHRFVGFGAGYRWYYDDTVNLSLTININYEEEHFSNPGNSDRYTDYELKWMPGIIGGIRF